MNNIVKKKYEIEGIKFYIETIDNKINIVLDSNINIGINGELGLVSTKNVCIDTLNSKLYLNSRKSDSIKDLQDSIDYRENQDKLHKKHLEMMENEHERMINRIKELEKMTDFLSTQVEKLTSTSKR